MMRYVDKVVAYITRGSELLIFAHTEFPGAGLQVPAGSMDPGETPQQAVTREIREETGLTAFHVARLLGIVEGGYRAGAQWHFTRRYFFHVTLSDTAPDRWRHWERHAGDGASYEFELFWVPLPDGVPPWPGSRTCCSASCRRLSLKPRSLKDSGVVKAAGAYYTQRRHCRFADANFVPVRNCQPLLQKPLLYGERVTLRPITVDDAAAMFAALDDAESMRLTGTQESFTFAQVAAFCARVADADDRADYAITRNGDPTYIGEAVLNEINWRNRAASFRIALAGSRFFGQGYGTEATRLIVTYGFEQLGLHRIELEVFAFNPRAQRVYEKVGFVREGVRRDALFWDGAFHDAMIMGLLASEFQVRLEGA